MTKSLSRFERTCLERLKLACDVLLELAEDDQISDGLEVELRAFKEQVERELLMPGSPGNAGTDWEKAIDLDIEEVRSRLEDTRIVRFTLDSLDGNLRYDLMSSHLKLGLADLRKKLAKMERRELRHIGNREYMILAPASHVEHFGEEAVTAVRTLDDLGLVIHLYH